MVLYPKSPRAVLVEDLAEIVAQLPARIVVVALFVDPEPSFVRKVLETGEVDLLQFHGCETANFCEQFETPYMKALAVKPDSDLQAALAPYESAQYILLDSYDPMLHGGTGKTFDWKTLEELSEHHKGRLVLAGGLQPDNVTEAIEKVHPFGVDVSSGVEASKGIKDHLKMKLFIQGVRASG